MSVDGDIDEQVHLIQEYRRGASGLLDTCKSSLAFIPPVFGLLLCGLIIHSNILIALGLVIEFLLVLLLLISVMGISILRLAIWQAQLRLKGLRNKKREEQHGK